MQLDRLTSAIPDRLMNARRRLRPSLPLTGYSENRASAPLVELLTDEQLAELNRLLPWSCFTVDGRGRRFGQAAWSGKRVEPQPVPDRRTLLLHEAVDLSDKHVLEVGCFEGVHTIGLARVAKTVTAIDARVANVVKTIVRCTFYGVRPDVLVCDVEDAHQLASLECDVVHHVGVLYHLQDPVRHLQRLSRISSTAILLDTHVASDDEAVEILEVDGHHYPYRRYREPPSVFSGMGSEARWLRLADIRQILEDGGFAKVEMLEERAERNGPRVLLLARKN